MSSNSIYSSTKFSKGHTDAKKQIFRRAGHRSQGATNCINKFDVTRRDMAVRLGKNSAYIYILV